MLRGVLISALESVFISILTSAPKSIHNCTSMLVSVCASVLTIVFIGTYTYVCSKCTFKCAYLRVYTDEYTHKYVHLKVLINMRTYISILLGINIQIEPKTPTTYSTGFNTLAAFSLWNRHETEAEQELAVMVAANSWRRCDVSQVKGRSCVEMLILMYPRTL